MTEIVQNNKNIIIFDSNCLICNTFIQYIHKIDVNNYFLFAGFDSSFIRKMNISLDRTTILLITSTGTKIKSEAILDIFEILKYHMLAVKILKLLPIKIINTVYDLLSRNRLIFGKNEQSCSIELKSKILE